MKAILNKDIAELTAEMRQTFHSSYLPFVDSLANGTKPQFEYAKQHILRLFPQYKNHIDELYKIRFENKVQAVNNLTETGDQVMRETIATIDSIGEQLTALRASLVANFFIDGGPEPDANQNKPLSKMNVAELTAIAKNIPGFDETQQLTKAELREIIEEHQNLIKQ